MLWSTVVLGVSLMEEMSCITVMYKHTPKTDTSIVKSSSIFSHMPEYVPKPLTSYCSLWVQKHSDAVRRAQRNSAPISAKVT